MSVTPARQHSASLCMLGAQNTACELSLTLKQHQRNAAAAWSKRHVRRTQISDRPCALKSALESIKARARRRDIVARRRAAAATSHVHAAAATQAWPRSRRKRSPSRPSPAPRSPSPTRQQQIPQQRRRRNAEEPGRQHEARREHGIQFLRHYAVFPSNETRGASMDREKRTILTVDGRVQGPRTSVDHGLCGRHVR